MFGSHSNMKWMKACQFIMPILKNTYSCDNIVYMSITETINSKTSKTQLTVWGRQWWGMSLVAKSRTGLEGSRSWRRVRNVALTVSLMTSHHWLMWGRYTTLGLLLLASWNTCMRKIQQIYKLTTYLEQILVWSNTISYFISNWISYLDILQE